MYLSLLCYCCFSVGNGRLARTYVSFVQDIYFRGKMIKNEGVRGTPVLRKTPAAAATTRACNYWRFGRGGSPPSPPSLQSKPPVGGSRYSRILKITRTHNFRTHNRCPRLKRHLVSILSPLVSILSPLGLYAAHAIGAPSSFGKSKLEADYTLKGGGFAQNLLLLSRLRD